MSDESKKEPPLCYSDLISLLRRSKRSIIKTALICSTLGIFLALIQPIKYEAEGTFREKGNKNPGISSQLYEMLSGGSSLSEGESEAMTMIKSRKFLEKIIDEHNLQADLKHASDSEGLFSRLKNNLTAFFAKFKSREEPCLSDPNCDLKVDKVSYKGEVPLAFSLTLYPDSSFELFDHHAKKNLGKGRLNTPFESEDLKISLIGERSIPQKGYKKYNLSVNPLWKTYKQVSELLDVDSVKNDKTLLKVTFLDRDRKKAANFLNSVMSGYQEFLQNSHKTISDKQIDYLNIRREDLTDKLCTLIQKHANFLSGDLYSAGFIDTNKEVEFLAMRKQEYKQKLFANELETRRLSGLNPSALAFYDRYSLHEGDPGVINNILSEMRSLKQFRDSIQIELHKSSPARERNIEQNLDKQFVELQRLQGYSKELKEIIARLKRKESVNTSGALYNDPRFLIKGWFERLDTASQADEKNHKKTQESLEFYLNNLYRLFGVHEQILQERLTHRHSTPEYQGITLEASKELYLDYSKQLVKNEATIRQNLFFIDQMKDPTFEITSLSSSLTDPIGKEMVQRASELVLNLRDQNNQSVREQERIKEELDLQRTFLALHLQQMVQLMELSNQLIQEKIYSLQNVSLELIHQQISLLEKNLDEYIGSRLKNLEQEKLLLEERLGMIHTELAFLPDKWVSEKLLQQEVEVNQKIVEEIAKMVESKNIIHNLEVIQSAPVDSALVPLYPKTPKVVIGGVAGFILGGILSLVYFLIQAIVNGIRVSKDNLKELGLLLSGSLSEGSPLETVRKVLAFFLEGKEKEKGNILLLVEGKGPDYSPLLTSLLEKRGGSLLIIDLDFNHYGSEHENTLLSYLEGSKELPRIEKTSAGDRIVAGKKTLFAPELLSNGRFEALLEEMSKQYKWILVCSKASATSTEAEVLYRLIETRAITLTNEKIEDAASYLADFNKTFKGRTTFVLS